MVLLEIPAIQEASCSKRRLPEFLCLSVPTLTAERVIQLPDPRTNEDPVAAFLGRSSFTGMFFELILVCDPPPNTSRFPVRGIDQLSIIALISSLLNTALPELPGIVEDTNHIDKRGGQFGNVHSLQMEVPIRGDAPWDSDGELSVQVQQPFATVSSYKSCLFFS